MNKKLSILYICALTLILIIGMTTQANAALGVTTLKIGSTGPDVVELQTKLNYMGFYASKTDGIYGSQTVQGVKSFQTSENLTVDGIVGSVTASALNSAYTAKLHQDKVNAILITAKQYLGIRYQWGGSTPATGFDCSGFTSYVFAQNGITLPRVSRDQFNVGTPVNFNNLQPGDLVFFSIANDGIVDHVGIYVGGDQFINASSSKGVTIYTIGPYWKSIFMGAKRVF